MPRVVNARSGTRATSPGGTVVSSAAMTRPAPRLVMVGFRKGLLAAARARGLPVVVVDEVPPGARALRPGAVEQVLVIDRGDMAQLAGALPRDRPLIVVGTAERLVRAAAELADALELDWPTPA